MKRIEAVTQVCAGAALLSIASCSERSDQRLDTSAASDRRFVDVVIDTVWSRGSLRDTVIEFPRRARAQGDLLVITDGARRGVVALRTADGTTAWVAGQQGRGPGEYERPSAIEALPDGRFVVADTEVGRVTILDRSGAYLGEFRLEDPQVQGLCALADSSIVATAATDGPNFTRLSLTGQVLGRHVVPWPDLVDTEMLARQFVAATAPDRKTCYIGLTLGRGFGVFDGQQFLFTKDYIERVGTPPVETTESRSSRGSVTEARIMNGVIATRSITVSPDRFYVLFEGSSGREAARIVDVYTREGQYEHSFRLPERARELVWADGVFYVLSEIEGVPMIAALRIRRAA